MMIKQAIILFLMLGNSKRADSFSIFVCTDRYDKMDVTGNNLCTVLNGVASDDTIVKPSVFIIGGDNVGNGPDIGTNGHPDFSVNDVIEEVHSVFPDGQVLMTFGSHDTAAQEGMDEFLAGPAEQSGFYVYGVTFAQMRYADRESAEEKSYAYLDVDAQTGLGAVEGTAAFTAWVNTLEDHLPIIVMSHMPLHANRGDNVGAAIWTEALNEAAKEHPVIVLFGHNHTSEENATEEKPSCDPAYYLVPAGGSMPIQQKDVAAADCENLEILFTYMNAGYITLGYGSVITFEDISGDGMYDRITIARYSAEGLSPDFGTTGLVGPYSFDLTTGVKE